jgi:hypothetical protein
MLRATHLKGAKDMTDLTAESITEFFKQATEANTRAWNSQVTYFEELVKRNTECFKGLGEARIASFKEISEATTFNQAFESNLSFEEKLREDLAGLQDKNTRAWEALIEDLTAIYTPPVESAKAPAAKAKAPAAKKPVSRKAA